MGRARRLRFHSLIFVATLSASVALAASVASAGPQNRAAGSFLLSGRLTAVPPAKKGSRRLGVVRVVRVETGEVVAAQQLPRSLKYRIPLRAGAYIVVAFAANAPGRRHYQAVSHVVRAKSRGRLRLNLRVGAGRKARARSSTAAGVASASGLRAGIKYVGVTPKMVISGSEVPRGAIDQMLVSDISENPCGGKTRLQALEIEHRADLIKEIKLSQSPYADPSTRLENHLISPGYMVVGGGSQSGGTLQMELNMLDVKTGQSVAGASVSGPASSFFALYGQLQKSFIEDACREDKLPYHYKVLDAALETHASGKSSGDVCSSAGITSGGTRDFSGTMTTQDVPPASRVEQLTGSQDVSGSIKAKVAAKWTNDHLDGCRPQEPEGLVACQLNTPDRSPEPGGTWEIVYSLDVQPPTGSNFTGHWSVPDGEIGFVSGGVDPECPITPFLRGAVSWDETAQSYPASTFTTPGQHTIGFSGSRHFSTISGELDYSWSLRITFERVS